MVWAPLFSRRHTSRVTTKVRRHIMLLQNRLEKKFPSCKWQLDKQHYRLNSLKMLQTWLPPGLWITMSPQNIPEKWREGKRLCECDRPSSFGLLKTNYRRFNAAKSSIMGKPGEPSSRKNTAEQTPNFKHPRVRPGVGKLREHHPRSEGRREDSLCFSFPLP